jgi:hypothetical protein
MLQVIDLFVVPNLNEWALSLSFVHSFPLKRYSCIWFQWVMGYVTDDDLLALLKRAKAGLTDDGFIIIKDNCLPYELSCFPPLPPSFISSS